MAQVRLDKWLQVARVFKTRSQATRACTLNRVRVNGLPAKAHKSLAIGDRVEAEIGDWTRILVVRELRDKPVKKADAAALYSDESPPRPQLTDLERMMRKPVTRRERGLGRPTKKERRDIEKWHREQ